MSGMMTAWVLAAVLVPLVYPLLALVPGMSGLRRYTLALLPVPALLLALLSGHGWSLELPWLITGGLWQLDELRRGFLLLTTLLWMTAGVYAAGYCSEQKLTRFGVFWALTLAGNLGLILAADIAGFYSFFALMTFAGYGLVVHDGNPDAMRAGRVYLVMAVLGEMAMLAALMLAGNEAGSLLLADLPAAIAASDRRDLMIGLVLAGFGVKAGLPLLHFWLPLAHPVAPVPASAVLSGAMIKAGLLGWLLLLPLGEAALPGWGLLVMVAGAVAALGAAAVGVCQRKPKAVLAYSSISQMGLITLMVGAALAEPARAPLLFAVITLYALHHGLAKGSLFLAAGLSLPRSPAGRALLWLGIALPGLSLAGLPFTSGAVSKLAMKHGLAPETLTFTGAGYLAPLMTAGAVATLLLVLRTLWTLRETMAVGRIPRAMLLGWLLASLCSLVLFWFLPWGLPGAQQPSWVPSLYDGWALVWPLLLAAALALLVWRCGVRAPQIPAGDGLVLLEAMARALRRSVGSSGLWPFSRNRIWRLRGEALNRGLGRVLSQWESGYREQLALLLLLLILTGGWLI